MLIARYPGSPNPTRRAIGEYPALSLEQAREQARQWRQLIRRGIDPKAEEERLRREELKKLQTTFAAVAEDFLDRHVKGQRRAKDTEREIRKELITQWADRPIASITREDVVLLVDHGVKPKEPVKPKVDSGYRRIGLDERPLDWLVF